MVVPPITSDHRCMSWLALSRHWGLYSKIQTALKIFYGPRRKSREQTTEDCSNSC